MWQENHFCGFMENCVIPALESVHDLAVDPKITNSSQLLHHLLQPCAPWIYYDMVERELSSTKSDFFKEMAEAVGNRSTLSVMADRGSLIVDR